MHISDLHVGKRLYEYSLIEDQIYILDQIVEAIKEEKIDGLLIAGDVYDKSVPSAEAVRVLDRFLTKVANLQVPIFMISGNHDSAERTAFGSQLMKERQVYISPVYDGKLEKISLQDEYGIVDIYLMPFLKPAMVRHALPEEEIETYEDAIKAVLKQMKVEEGHRNILVAHQFVIGAKKCESEEISIGGVDQVGVDIFDAFDYVALGHIHSPQKIGRDTVRYCGTPLKYSFSEEKQQKSICIVEMKEKGEVELRLLPLIPKRELRTVRGTYEELMEKGRHMGKEKEDYIQVILTDEDDIIDGLQKLRTIYPKIMHLEYDNQRTRAELNLGEAMVVEKKSEFELIQEFYQQQNQRPMGTEQEQFIQEILENLMEG